MSIKKREKRLEMIPLPEFPSRTTSDHSYHHYTYHVITHPVNITAYPPPNRPPPLIFRQAALPSPRARVWGRCAGQGREGGEGEVVGAARTWLQRSAFLAGLMCLSGGQAGGTEQTAAAERVENKRNRSLPGLEVVSLPLCGLQINSVRSCFLF